MEEIWEEDDIISSLLHKEGLDQPTKDVGEALFKSLHQEFIEVGEDYNIPKKKFSLQNMMREFHQINKVVDEEIKRKQSDSSLKDESDLKERSTIIVKPIKKTVSLLPDFTEKQINEETGSRDVPPGFSTKKVVKPPPGFAMKQINEETGSRLNAPAGFSTKKVVKPPPGFAMRQINEETESRLDAPPGFSTKKVVKPPPGFAKKQRFDVPAGLALKNVNARRSYPVPPPGFTKEHSRKPKSFSSIMNEFNSLSSIMDKELQTYKAKTITMQDQKQCHEDNLKDVGRVDMLKTLLYEQQNQMKNMEKQHEIEIQKLKMQHKEEMKIMKKQNNGGGKANEKLQIEFNKVLNDREEEIDNLNATIHDLQFELESYQSGSDDIATENEELLEKIDIKDEYISSLKLQLTNFEKLHEQDEWKLQQADDNLEMVEREHDHFQKEATKRLKYLGNELLAERERSHKMEHYIQVMHEQLQKQKQPINEQQQILSDGQQQPQKIINEQQNRISQPSRLQSTPTVIDSNSPVFKEKLAKMAQRSMSNVSRVSTSIRSDKKMPTVLKSLGWLAAQ